MIGLYIHIPFCIHKCLYCDFPSYGGILQYRQAYVEAVCREIDSWSDAAAADTVYFGGGTPSLLEAGQIGAILDHLQKKFTIDPAAEITVEANPDSMTAAYAAALCSYGVNRISLGVQSFNDDMLRFLGRIHTAEQALQSVRDVYDAGIDNISIDLMYGLPRQTADMVKYDMDIMKILPVCHASAYSLIVEAGTVLKNGLDQGEFTLPDDKKIEEMGKLVHDSMHAMGFSHYEISSYAKAGRQSRHNCKYWQYTPYIGFGVSAHSFDGSRRWANISNIPDYIRRAGQQSVIGESIDIQRQRAMEDYCFLALRLRKGIEYADFERHFGVSLQSVFGDVVRRLSDQGLLEKTGKGCCMTEEGLSYGNYVFSRFI